jgi:hypothetical protein
MVKQSVDRGSTPNESRTVHPNWKTHASRIASILAVIHKCETSFKSQFNYWKSSKASQDKRDKHTSVVCYTQQSRCIATRPYMEPRLLDNCQGEHIIIGI